MLTHNADLIIDKGSADLVEVQDPADRCQQSQHSPKNFAQEHQLFIRLGFWNQTPPTAYSSAARCASCLTTPKVQDSQTSEPHPSRTCTHPCHQGDNPTIIEQGNYAVTHRVHLAPLHQDPFCYEWFWLLIAMIGINTCFTTLTFLLYSSVSFVDLDSTKDILKSLLYLIAPPIIWTLTVTTNFMCSLWRRRSTNHEKALHEKRRSVSRLLWYLIYLGLLTGGIAGSTTSFWIKYSLGQDSKNHYDSYD